MKQIGQFAGYLLGDVRIVRRIVDVKGTHAVLGVAHQFDLDLFPHAFDFVIGTQMAVRIRIKIQLVNDVQQAGAA